MTRLGDAFTLIRNGASIKQTESAGGIPITRIETISNRDINRNKLGYAGISDAKKYSDYILQDNDFGLLRNLFSFSCGYGILKSLWITFLNSYVR